MVTEMDDLDEIRGYITFSDEPEKKKEQPDEKMIDTEEGATIDKLKQEAGEKILTVDGEDIIEKFKGKVLHDFLPCELLA